MIKITQSRVKDGTYYDQGSFEASLQRALEHLVLSELSFGGSVTDLTPEQITVKTECRPGCLDTTVYSGSAEDLRPLLEVVYFHLQACSEYHEAILERSVDDLHEQLPESVRGVPLFMSLTVPRFVGHNRLKVASMLAAGIHDEETIKVGLRERLKDVLAAIALQVEGVCPFREALAA